MARSKSGDGKSEPPATALTAAFVFVKALQMDAGQIIITVQHPGIIAIVDVHRRMKPEEVDLVPLASGM